MYTCVVVCSNVKMVQSLFLVFDYLRNNYLTNCGPRDPSAALYEHLPRFDKMWLSILTATKGQNSCNNDFIC